MIRESRDQCSFDSSPRLIAAFHALLRLPAPRHPPHALSNLATWIHAPKQEVALQPRRMTPRDHGTATEVAPPQYGKTFDPNEKMHPSAGALGRIPVLDKDATLNDQVVKDQPA